MATLRTRPQCLGPEDVLLSPAGPFELSDNLKGTICECFWGGVLGTVPQYDSYFRTFSRECRLAGRNLPIRTLRHLLSLVEYLKSRNSWRRRDLLEFFDSSSDFSISENWQKYDAIDLAIRLWLMLNFQRRQSWNVGIRTSTYWPEDWSLEQMIANLFPHHPPNALEKPRWPHMFNARMLEHIGNLKIVWTDDLQDHLLLDEDDRSIRFYHHATVLNTFISGTADGCLPKDLLLETQQTLALLLPSRVNRDCRRWFERQLQAAEKQRGLVDPQAGNQILHLEGRLPRTYKYWGERLSIIKNALDEAEPSTLYQWWTDKRKGVQRWTFWLAAIALLLTVFFGLAQTLLAACQVYLMFNPPMR